MLKIALLDDYARVALKSADWSVLKGRAEITVFDRHLSEDEAAALLRPFDVLCTIRERMIAIRDEVKEGQRGRLALDGYGHAPRPRSRMFDAVG